MAASQIGHGQIGKIIEDMEELLPFVSVDRADYRACRTTYGCLSSTYKRSNDSSTPEKEYKELQALEKTLRHRLSSLDADRGLPRKFKGPLDDLKSGVDGALECGVSTDFLIQGLKDALEYKPDATPAPKPVPPKMVSEKRFKTVLDELRNEKEKNRKLNEENNRMALELKQYQMRERSAQTGRRPGAGFYQDYKDTDCSTYFDVNCIVHAICSAVHQKRTQVERGYQ